MNGADRKHAVETQVGEFRRLRHHAIRVHLVDHHEDRFARLAQADRRLAIQGDDAFLDIHDEEDDLRRFEGDLDLLHGRLDDDVLRFLAAQQPDAARIHQRERTTVPLDLGGDAIARDPRLVMHDGDAATGDAIEQG